MINGGFQSCDVVYAYITLAHIALSFLFILTWSSGL